MTREPHSSQGQLILDLWQAESAEERYRLLETHADQANADLITMLHACANEASKMGEHLTTWDLVTISQEGAQYLGDPKLKGDCHSQAGLLHFHQDALKSSPFLGDGTEQLRGGRC